LFIEKPLANSLTGVDELLRLVTEHDLVVESGFMLRLHPNLRWIKEFVDGGGLGVIHYARALVGQYLPDWRPGTDYRTSYSADGNEGGVLFDLVHEFDLVGWLLGPLVEVVAMTRHSPSLEIASESIAQVGVRCIDGVLAQIQLDYLRTTFTRNLEIVGSEGTLVWDYTAGTVAVILPGGHAVVRHRVGPAFERNDMFVHHMAHFIARLSNRALAPCSSLHNGVAAMRVALASHLSARERRFVAIENLVEAPLADRRVLENDCATDHQQPSRNV
jgi:predicted dehydrogenase